MRPIHEQTIRITGATDGLGRALAGELAAEGATVLVHDFDDVMLDRGYSPVRAYCQSKLAQIMFTFDLAAELDGTGVTANSLHPATYMPTKMVSSPTSTLEEGLRATHRLVTDPALNGVSGRFFDGLDEARADPQAYDSGARAHLRTLSEELTNP